MNTYSCSFDAATAVAVAAFASPPAGHQMVARERHVQISFTCTYLYSEIAFNINLACIEEITNCNLLSVMFQHQIHSMHAVAISDRPPRDPDNP